MCTHCDIKIPEAGGMNFFSFTDIMTSTYKNGLIIADQRGPKNVIRVTYDKF